MMREWKECKLGDASFGCYDYIARDSKFYAAKVSQDIVEKSERLNDFPEIGRIVPVMDCPIKVLI
ncbi:MAG: type II toxin-antitoxin system RelE/ParE family toxin [Pseudomonadota bacterium]